ncbi:MAG: xanthine dehydrogenase accessory protein XdhC [Pseudomonadota bacterium]
MRRWHHAIHKYESDGTPYVLVTLLATSGSTPRLAGTKMVVTATGSTDTIGGGQLEYRLQEKARTLLNAQQGAPVIEHLPLAVAADQCCGGSVTALLEPRLCRQTTLWVFGAGHVAARVVALAAELPVRIRWLDNRARADLRAVVALPEHPLEHWSDPVEALADAAAGDQVLVLTHDHELDYRLVARCLENHSEVSLALIGSATKWNRFKARLKRQGIGDAALASVRCPIGNRAPHIEQAQTSRQRHKEPMAIAVAIVAELLELLPDPQPQRGLSWSQIKLSLVAGPQPPGGGD